MKAELESKISDIRVDLIEGSGGVFEVEKDGQLIFSKKQLGRFPDSEELLQKLK